MSASELKSYIGRAAELEVAIYTQKKLMREHQDLMKKQRPEAPKEPSIERPISPNKPDTEILQGKSIVLTVGILIAFGIFIIIACCAFMTAFPALGIIMLLSCAFGYFNIINQKISAIRNAKIAKKQYEYEISNYKRKMAEFQREYQSAYKNYSEMNKKWTIYIDEYDVRNDIMFEKHNEILKALESSLEEHYKHNIVFPKYRNMVAITTINEYLLSGRCSELEGSNGAYNLYEMELRQNIIIGQLSNIVNNLEQIRNNQYSLYQELVKANSTVTQILHEVHGIKENTKLTAYFAGVTALIEATPKTYISRTF